MKSLDAQVRELLAVDSENVTVSLPMPFHHRLILAGRRKFGTISKPDLIKKALAHAAAIGLLAWEKDLNGTAKAHKPKLKRAKRTVKAPIKPETKTNSLTDIPVTV
jgi:hypothetical protein